MSLRSRRLVRRLIVYILGMFILTLGVGFTVRSGLGISPVNSIAYVLSEAIGCDMGMMSTLTFFFYILLQVLVLRRQFKLTQLLQIPCAMLYGSFVTLSTRLLAFPTPESYLPRFLLMLAGILFVAGGIAVYLVADLIPQPAEGVCLAVQQVSGWAYSKIKVAFDCALVATAALLSWLLLGGIEGLREGTLLSMLGVGPVIGILNRLFQNKIEAFCMVSEDSL